MLSGADNLGMLLVEPVVATGIGVLVGLTVLGLTRAGSRFVTATDPGRGFAKAMVLVLLGIISAFGSLLLYFTIAREAFLWYSLALVVGYFLALAYEVFKASCSLSCNRFG